MKKEYRVMIMPNAKWAEPGKFYVMGGVNCRNQPHFSTREEAKTWLEKTLKRHIEFGHDWYATSKYKIESRSVTEWEDDAIL